MQLIFIYLLFFATEYVLRTFVHPYKYHELPFILDILPLGLAALASIIIHRKAIVTRLFNKMFIKLIAVSVAGLLSAKLCLFVQWYYIMAPEYRQIPGDMMEGFAWLCFNSIMGMLTIAFTYIFIGFSIRTISGKSRPRDK